MKMRGPGRGESLREGEGLSKCWEVLSKLWQVVEKFRDCTGMCGEAGGGEG